MKKRLLPVLIIVVAAAAAFLIYRHGDKGGEGLLALSGNVEVTEVNVGFKMPGRIERMLAEEGQRVRTDDRLAVLDSAETESQVEQGRAHLEEARARLQELRAGSRSQEIEQARANVGHAEAELAKAGKDYERAEVLFRNGAVSAQQMDSARRAYEVAASQHRGAVERLSLVREGARREEITAAESRVRQAEAGLRAARTRLSDAVLSAPVSGVILSKNAETGETASTGMPVYTIGDLGNPWIKVYVREVDLGRVKIGQKAVITTDSYPGKSYTGRVTYISSEAEFTPKTVQTQEERVKLVFGVKVSAENRDDELKPGMPADVRIVLE